MKKEEGRAEGRNTYKPHQWAAGACGGMRPTPTPTPARVRALHLRAVCVYI